MAVVGSVFGFPNELIQNARLLQANLAQHSVAPSTLDSGSHVPTPAAATAHTPALPSEAGASKWNETGATCITCGIGINGPGFTSQAEQRAHYKGDWHRFNLKRKLRNQAPVTETQFEHLLEEEGDVSSISGSETESDEDDEAAGPGMPAVHSLGHHKRGKQQGSTLPQAVFLFDDNQPFAVWRCLLAQDHTRDLPSHQEQLQSLKSLRSQGGTWVLLLLRGGHFAAAVFRMKENLSRQKAQRGGSGGAASKGVGGGDAFEGTFEVVAHKTFHRYVVRAKSGGKQSTKDASGKFAKSAGSRLRRYNEQALERDIQELLHEWKDHLAAASLIFLHSPSSNSKILFPPVNAPLSSQDPRIRRVPFVTQRPTFSETKRVLRVLTNVYQPVLEEQVAPADAAPAVSPRGAADNLEQGEGRQRGKNAGGVEDEDDEARRVSSSGAGTGQVEDPPLHKAARAGDADRVAALLAEGADPTGRDGRGRTAYVVAGSKEVRDAFRRAMAREPERWDWTAAQVPSPLTDDLEAAQAAKRDAKKAKQKAKQKEIKEKKDKKKAEEGAKGGASKGGNAADNEDEEDEISRALREANLITARADAAKRAKPQGGKGAKGAAPVQPSAADVARRREQMAAAAEARMKALQDASQQQRLWS